jgi:hypothetical protein
MAFAILTSSLAYAQTTEEQTSTTKVIITTNTDENESKSVDIAEVNGEKIVTITTTKNGKTTIEKYTGEEAEAYLEENNETMIVEMEDINLEDMQFTFDLEGMEEGDGKKIIFKTKSTEASPENSHQVIWTTEDNEKVDVEFEDVDIEINETEDGESMKIELNFTDKDGKKVEKVIVMDESEIESSIKAVETLLEDLNVNIEMNLEGTDSKDDSEEPAVITRKIIIAKSSHSNEAESSTIFNEIKVTPNSSKQEIQINFEPKNKSKMKISVSDSEGNVLFVDSYNGKSSYSKTIKIPNYKGVVMVKIEQGNEIEIRKLIME